jgi:hypothetical protein
VPFGLDLGFTAVTDAGRKELAGLERLQSVTYAGIAELHNALPGRNIP